MTGLTVGDRAQAFQSLKSGSAIKETLDRLGQELSSGEHSDVAKRLNGQTSDLAHIAREIKILDGFAASTQILELTLQRKQAVLVSVSDLAAETGPRLAALSSTTPTSQLAASERAGADMFAQSVDRLNSRFGGQALFAGDAVDKLPLADAQTILNALDTSLTGLTDPDAITTAIQSWFADPIGGFSAVGYLGDTGPDRIQQIGPDDRLVINGRADDEAIRDTLAAFATAAVSGRMSDSLSLTARSTLLQTAGEGLMSASAGVNQISAQIGEGQAVLEKSVIFLRSQKLGFSMAQNDLLRVDAFSTASQLQSVQQQLEVHYTATARLSRLSLANYL